MRILITGGTGSWGTALIEHYLKQTEHRVVCYSRSELNQARLKERFPDPRLDCFLGDIRDLPRLRLAFEADIDIVIHCAALKRVDAISYNPEESIKTNIVGSMNVLQAARGTVKKCLLISSDKAVQPTNMYGATKMVAEHLFVTSNAYSIPKGTASAVLRAGNAIGSNGSVIPLWRQQIFDRLPLTVTDPSCTRFLISFPQAIAMIETALATMEGGEIFVPRLPAARLDDLARAVGAPDWSITVVGLRPGGEKRHETLLTEEESLRARSVHAELAGILPELHPWFEGLSWSWDLRDRIPAGAWNSLLAPRLAPEALRELVRA